MRTALIAILITGGTLCIVLALYAESYSEKSGTFGNRILSIYFATVGAAAIISTLSAWLGRGLA